MPSQLKHHKPKIWAAISFIAVLLVPFTFLPELSGLNDAQVKTVLILLLAAVLWVSEWLPLFIVSFIILALELTWLSPSVQELGLTVSDSLFFAPFFFQHHFIIFGRFCSIEHYAEGIIRCSLCPLDSPCY